MKTLRNLLIVLAALFVLYPLTAQSAPGPKPSVLMNIKVSGAAFTTLAMNTAKTFDALWVEGLDYVTFYIDHVNDSATAITMTCKAGRSSTTTDYLIQVLSYSGATAQSDTHTWSQAVAGNESWAWTANVNAYRYITCTFTATSGVADDTLTVTAHGGN